VSTGAWFSCDACRNTVLVRGGTDVSPEWATFMPVTDKGGGIVDWCILCPKCVDALRPQFESTAHGEGVAIDAIRARQQVTATAPPSITTYDAAIERVADDES